MHEWERFLEGAHGRAKLALAVSTIGSPPAIPSSRSPLTPGASGNASESLAEPAVRHLANWPQLRPDLPVSGVVLIINHQARIDPLDRTPAHTSARSSLRH
jgi:hypothetical protein